MWGKRSLETKIDCKECGNKLTVRRHCRQVDFVCSGCGKVTGLKEHLDQLDDELEDFIAASNVDRI